jgi:CDP-glycerol glycerophosphotransferase
VEKDAATAFFAEGWKSEKAKNWEAAASAYSAAVRLSGGENPQWNFRLTKALYETGEFELALAPITRALELTKATVSHHHLYHGMILENLGNTKGAIESLERAISLQDKPAVRFDTWHARLAGCYAKEDQWQEAEASFRAAISYEPKIARYHSALAEALAHQGKLEEAAAEYETAAQTAANPSSNHVKRAECLEKLKLWTRAADAYSDAIATATTANAGLYLKLAEMRKKTQQWWQQIDALERAIGLGLTDAQPMYDLANAYEMMGRFEQAAETFEVAVRRQPGNAQWEYRLGYCYERTGDLEAAEVAYARAVDLEPQAAVQGEAWFHGRRRLWDFAVTALERRLETNPMSGELHYRLGMAHDRSYRWEKATESYLDALAIDPQQPDWHYRLGYILERQSRLKEAVAAYRAAISQHPKPSQYWRYRLGYALWSMGDFKEAAQAWRAMRMAPALPSVAAEAKAPAKAGEATAVPYSDSLPERKLKLFEKSLSAGVLDADGWQNLAEQGESLGQMDIAAEAYAAAIDRSNEHKPQLYFRLGCVLLALKRHEEACAAFRDTRIIKRAYGIDTAAYTKTPTQKLLVDYAEHLETLPVRRNVVLYESNLAASVGCNPKAIFDYLTADENYADWLHVWSITPGAVIPKDLQNRPNVIVIHKDSEAYIRYLATASHLVNNSTFPAYFIRRPEQKYLNTWHGTPLKTLGIDMSVRGSFMGHKNTARNLLHATHVISPNAHTSRVLIERNGIQGAFSGQLAHTGYPRIDRMINATTAQRQSLRRRLRLSEDQPVVLYAPTWRGEMGKVEVDSDRLAADLKAFSDCGCQVLFRGHHYSETALAGIDVPARVVPKEIDTYDLLSVVDVLITDYSSIFFDFLPMRRPVLFYCYDLEQYVEERGGLYFDFAEMPGPLCQSIDKAADALRNFLATSFEPDATYETALNKFAAYEDGQATKRAVSFFMEDDQADVVAPAPDSRTRLVFYEGPFMPNGITSSFLNLTKSLDPQRYDITVAIDPDSIATAPERLEKLKGLPEHTHVIGRVGAWLRTAEERWVGEHFEMHNGLPTEHMWDVYNTACRREYRRMFGYARYDAHVLFEGYSRFWSAIFSCPADERARNVIYLHNDMHAEWKVRFRSLEGLFHIYRNYAAVVSVSKAMSDVNREKLATAFDIDASKFVACPNVIDGEAILRQADEPLDPELAAWAKGSRLFANLGRLSPEKDQAKLIRAFAKVYAQDRSAKLVILGEGPLRHELERLISDLRLNDVVKLAGQYANPFPVLKRCECFVLSSNHEGQPMVLLEAMVLGKPIVATDIDGNRGVLGDGHGALVENSVEGMRDGLQAFLAGRLSFPGFDWRAYRQSALDRFGEIVEGSHSGATATGVNA